MLGASVPVSRRTSSPHGLVAALAGLSGNAGPVGVVSQLSSSICSPDEHIAEQISGRAGCLAWAGRGGIWASLTGGGGKSGGALAQAVKSAASSVSVSARGVELMSCSIEGLLLFGVDLRLFGALFGLSGRGGLPQPCSSLGSVDQAAQLVHLVLMPERAHQQSGAEHDGQGGHDAGK